jgi:hypothetical protein
VAETLVGGGALAEVAAIAAQATHKNANAIGLPERFSTLTVCQIRVWPREKRLASGTLYY